MKDLSFGNIVRRKDNGKCCSVDLGVGDSSCLLSTTLSHTPSAGMESHSLWVRCWEVDMAIVG